MQRRWILGRLARLLSTPLSPFVSKWMQFFEETKKFMEESERQYGVANAGYTEHTIVEGSPASHNGARRCFVDSARLILNARGKDIKRVDQQRTSSVCHVAVSVSSACQSPFPLCLV